jgi:hypothetical protein
MNLAKNKTLVIIIVAVATLLILYEFRELSVNSLQVQNGLVLSNKQLTNSNKSRSPINEQFRQPIVDLDSDIIDFEGFDNTVGLSYPIVPNIVHLIYLNHPFVKFYQMICIFSIFLNHRPDFIYIHCDNCSFTGKYWEEIDKVTELKQIIRLHKVPSKDTIFGIKVGWIHHR